MNKILVCTAAVGFLAACGSGSNAGPGGVFGTVTVSPLSQQAASIAATAPDAEPVALSSLALNEADSLNPGSTVSVSAQSADAEPVALGALPASAADPEKPNS